MPPQASRGRRSAARFCWLSADPATRRRPAQTRATTIHRRCMAPPASASMAHHTTFCLRAAIRSAAHVDPDRDNRRKSRSWRCAALALDGEPGMHDPSTVIQHDGKFYVYGTGNGLPGLVSDDGWTWRRAGSADAGGARRQAGRRTCIARGGNNTWAPDIIRVGDKYFLYYAAPGTQPKAAIGLLVGEDARSGVARLQVGGRRSGRLVRRRRGQQRHRSRRVSRSDRTGRLWLTYGSYFGYIRLVELDPKTGKRLLSRSRRRSTSRSIPKRRS